MSTVPEWVCRNEEILAKLVDGEAIFVNPSNGMYYSVERVGAAAWEMLDQGHTLATVAKTLSERYEVSPEQARVDLDKLANELLKAELVRAELGASPNAPAARPRPRTRRPVGSNPMRAAVGKSQPRSARPPSSRDVLHPLGHGLGSVVNPFLTFFVDLLAVGGKLLARFG